jgi:amidohydrolase
MTAWKHILEETIATLTPRLIDVRRHLHVHPEVSGEEHATTAFLKSNLKGEGLIIQTLKSLRGLIADVPAPPGKMRIAIRGDIDALRIQEGNQVEYRSHVDGVMHACGHDGHTAAVFGALLAIAKMHAQQTLPWPVPLRAIFQPAEETNLGAFEMIEAGALKDVHGIFSLHLDPARETGSIGVRPGPLTADCDEMHIVIRGRGGHAARPHESLDPIAAAAQLISSIYLFVPRSTDMFDPVVVTIGQIRGGENSNVIPDQVDLRGTLRSIGGEIRQRTMNHIRRLAGGVGDVSGTRISVEFISGPDAVINDPELTEILRSSAGEILGPENVRTIERPSMGGEDFSNYLAHSPGAMFRLGCAPRGRPAAPLHSPEFDFDERALSIGARVLAHTVISCFNPDRPRSPHS